MLKEKKNKKTKQNYNEYSYNELGNRQYCTVFVFTVVKTWSKSLFWNLYYNLERIESMDI